MASASVTVYAVSDLHLDHLENRRALLEIAPHPDDWLILGGDIGHREQHLELALETLTPRFRQVIWVPGNHDLWTLPDETNGCRGEAKYFRLVSICRRHGVLTPEDQYASLQWRGATYVFAPLFVLYDYSFAPDGVPAAGAVRWAMEDNTLCADELFLHPDPYPSRAVWCEARCRQTEERLAAVPREHSLVLINHFPLRRDLVRLFAPRFTVWCGTRRSEDWHERFRVAVVVTGHLHVRSTIWRGSVRFEEVSLGYPRQWHVEQGIESYLTRILPGSTETSS